MPAQYPTPSPRSEILSKVGDIKRLHPITLEMSPDEREFQRQKRHAELLIQFANAQDRFDADEMLADADAELEQQQLRSLLTTIDPRQIWLPVNRDDVLSGFLPGVLINHGGTSDIHLCWTRFNKHTVVIKLIKHTDSQARVDKLLALKEHQTLLKFTHPNIAKVYDAGYLKLVEDGREQIYPYLAMERLSGQTLESWIRNHLPCENADSQKQKSWLRTVANAGAVLARTLFHCHEKEIAHGDFKPNNVHVCGSLPTQETLKVYDFGFSADEDGHVHGETIGYSDPFVPAGDLNSLMCRDRYALGATLLFCATGKHPPETKDRNAHQLELSQTIGEVRDADLRLIMQKAMHGEVHQRYSTAKQLEEDLTAWLRDEPLPHQGRSYTWLQREKLLLRRCRQRDDIRDQTVFVSHVSVLLAIHLVVVMVLYLLALFAGIGVQAALFYATMYLDVIAVLLLSMSAIVVGGKKSARSQFWPLVALVLAITIYDRIVNPSTLFRPTDEESRQTLVGMFPLLGIFNIVQAANTPRWAYMQVPGWALLIATPLVRYLAEQPWFQNYTLLLVLIAEVVCCLTFSARGFAMEMEVPNIPSD